MISFARSVPAPECLRVDGLADCPQAVLQGAGIAVVTTPTEAVGLVAERVGVRT